MKKTNIKRGFVAIVLGMSLTFGLTGCDDRQSHKINYNVSLEADNFNVIRRLSVMSAITNKPVFELVGAFSFESTPDRLTILVETGQNQYKKHVVGFGENVVWVVEDVAGSNVEKYKYVVNFQPESIVPITFKNVD